MVAVKRAADSEEAKDDTPWALEVRELEPAEETLMKQLEKSRSICLDISKVMLMLQLNV